MATGRPIFQYPGRQGPVSTPEATRPEVCDVFLPALLLPILGSFDSPLGEEAVAETNAPPTVEATLVDIAPWPVLGSWDGPQSLEEARPQTYETWFVVAPQEALGSFDAPPSLEEGRPSTHDLQLPPPAWDLLGSFDAPISEESALLSEWSRFQPIIELGPPADILGSWAGALLDESLTRPTAPTELLPVVPPPAMDDGTTVLAPEPTRPDASEDRSPVRPWEILGSYERPQEVQTAAIESFPGPADLLPPAVTPAILGSHDAPPPQLEPTRPETSEDRSPILPWEVLGWFERPQEVESFPGPADILPPAPVPEILGSWDGPTPPDPELPVDRGHDIWDGWLERIAEWPILGSWDAPPFEAIIPGLLERNGNAVRSLFATQIAGPLGLLTQYDNAPPPSLPWPPSATPWCRFEVDLGSLEHRSTGRGNVFRKRGEFRALLHYPLEAGDGPMATAASAIVSAFRLVNAGGVSYGVPKVARRGRDKGWWAMEVSCPFWDDVEVAAPDSSSGALTGLDDAASVIRTRFDALIAAPEVLPTSWENAPFTIPDAEPWAMVTILPGDSDIAELGEEHTYRTPGVLMVRLFVPLEQGDARMRQLADLVIESFRTVRDRGVLFRTPSVGAGTAHGAWWTVNVECPFVFEVRAA